MTTLLPTSQSTGVEAYDDMFKEITRKLYGDESAHGLYPHNTQVAQLAPGAPTAPPDGGERSFTTLTQIGYETTTVGAGSASASGESASQQQSGSSSAASTAFGLAALMQNGFPPPGAILNPVNFAPGTSKTPTNISTPSNDNRWQSQHAADESWNTGKHSSTSGGYGGKSYKKPKTEPQDGGSSSLNIPSTADRTSKGGSGYGSGTAQGTTSSSSSSGTPQAYKRYSCTTCPYTTDRRDLFTRHENIHKDEKPFQCYACLKPFNRADHVKKHFLRMHRELEYDIAKTRRYPPSSSSASNASNKNTYYGHASQSANGEGTSNSAAATNSTSTTATQPPMQLNIPSGNFGSSSAHSLTIPSNVHESVSALQHHIAMSGINGGHSAGQLLQLHNLHHQQQQQQQQQQHNVHHPSISIKQEKGLASGGSSHNTSASSAGGSPDEKSFVKKIKGEKKFACTFCPWAGTDNWGLKRHLNTHTKPYVCLLCDYKAARSERLATHVLKVHNKKACGKCSFFAEDQAHLDAHLQEAHPHDPTKASKHTGTVSGGNGGSGNDNCDTGATHHPGGAAAANGNVLRNLGNAFTSNNLPTNIPTSGNGFGAGSSANGHYHTAGGHHAATGNVLTNSNAANLIDTINQHLASTGPNSSAASASSLQHHQQQYIQQHWMGKPHRKRNGAELLYSYLEADGSDSGDYARYARGDVRGGATAILANGSSQSALAKANDSVALSLASLLGGDQLSFLQLLATAAVAHQQLQLHSSQQPGPYGHGGLQKKQQQQQHQSQPKPSKAAAVHQAVVGAPNGDRYGSMPQNSFVSTKQQQQLTPPAAHSLPPSLLRIAPPSAVEEETNRPSCPVVIETEGQQFSLTEFLKNHTEVSISTVDAGGKGSEGKELADLADEAANDSSSPTEVSLVEKQKDTPAVVPLKKRKSEGERNPRKQQQPRRFDDSDGDTVPVKLALEEKPLVTVEPTVLSTPIAVVSQEDNRISKLDPCEAIETSGSLDGSCVSRLADIRDKHMTQLVSRRRCCRICQNQGRLDHLDNYHYHSKISLILHTLWRHGCDAGSQELRCHQCGSQFRQRYKLALHKRLMKHTGSAAGRKQRQKKSNVGTLAGEGKRSNGKENLATNGAHTNGSVPVKSSSEQKKTAAISLKKQRKRKPRSRCFTPRRRK
uniref:C2H2-type domain-containing protein n=1 Tax=Anopheles atroparvus TaxID=41427 RepID=A0A182JM30_ANOAO